ncbi:hypothetical protein BJ508DRAFT_331237 [Ascobolus immersus RN42]|uniref:Uncharacterized protein n=1 Tax=Ascobolus immersus RN42 TaxID=1160509 RepID=A0A3N4HR11_ASCIM|nr:hypothetical protein BJ508DRAFT_331237 [Ascobolus immersus RN42]
MYYGLETTKVQLQLQQDLIAAQDRQIRKQKAAIKKLTKKLKTREVEKQLAIEDKEMEAEPVVEVKESGKEGGEEERKVDIDDVENSSSSSSSSSNSDSPDFDDEADKEKAVKATDIVTDKEKNKEVEKEKGIDMAE